MVQPTTFVSNRAKNRGGGGGLLKFGEWQGVVAKKCRK
jgi:predicted outer membrane repeat protein